MHPRMTELFGYLDAQRAALKAAVDAVPAEARERYPSADEWSVAGILEHLSIVEHRIAGLLSALIVEAKAGGLAVETSNEPILPTAGLSRVIDRSTRVPAPDQLRPTGLSAAASWSALERAGAALREAARTGDGFAIGTIMRPHPLFGPISLYQWIAFAGAHEARHAAQIRERSPR